MPEISAIQRKKLERVVELGEKGQVAILKYLFELEDRLPQIEEIISRLKGDKGDDYVLTTADRKKIAELSHELVSYPAIVRQVLNLIDLDEIANEATAKIKVPDPIQPDLEKIAIEAAKLIPPPKDGEPGNDADEVAITQAVSEKIEKDLPKLGLSIRDGLELLPRGENNEPDERLEKEAIKGLDEELAVIRKQIASIPNNGTLGVTGRDLFKDIDLSDQLDGVTKTFNIQAIYNIITVDLSSNPFALRKGIDYTYTPTSITFTSQIDAASSLAAGQTCILTVVQA